MPLKLIREDITKLDCDAIVNAANPTLLGGGGVDGAIHKAAGPGLLEKCRKLGGCKTGEAKMTKGYDLHCKYVIHTVGPIWQGGTAGEEALLRSCYRNSLAMAKSRRCKTVAFPLISSGAYGYPKDQALKIAVDEITEFLLQNDLLVYLVIYDKTAYQIGEKLFDDIASYIDDKYIDEHFDFNYRGRRLEGQPLFDAEDSMFYESEPFLYEVSAPEGKEDKSKLSRKLAPSAAKPPRNYEEPTLENDGAPEHTVSFSLSRIDPDVIQLDESFSEMLLRKIDEKGMTDPECYKKANVDRKLFSKIRGDKYYKPSRTTAIAFCIALELPLEETKEMLMKAGYALSHSNKFDLIIEYFITNQNYNIFEINEALFAFDQSLLGA